jgi:hypothetical protein
LRNRGLSGAIEELAKGYNADDLGPIVLDLDPVAEIDSAARRDLLGN